MFDTPPEGLYNGAYPYPIPPEQQHNIDTRENHRWSGYPNNMIVTSDIFIQADIPPLDNSQRFDNMYKHPMPNFQSGKFSSN